MRKLNPHGVTWLCWINEAQLTWDQLKKIPLYKAAREAWSTGEDPRGWKHV